MTHRDTKTGEKCTSPSHARTHTHTHKYKTDYRYPSLKLANVSKVTTWMWWQIPV